MFDSLSKREKILLRIMTIVIIIAACQYFLIMPALNKHTALQGQLSQTSLQYDLTKMTLTQKDMNTANLQKAEAVLDETRKTFPTSMPNEQIDRLICGMARNAGLKTITVTINELVAEKTAGTTNATTSTDTTTATSLITNNSLIKTTEISLGFNGTRESFMKFLDAIEQTPYLMLINTSITNKDNIETYYADVYLYMLID